MSAETLVDPIPETVAEALRRWDADESVFTVDMGGMGPGYEMAIQGMAFEFMRVLDGFSDWTNEEKVKLMDAKLDEIVGELNKNPWGGFSGAQVGAPKNLACCVCRRGYRGALRDKAVADRLIQVSRKDLRKQP